MASRRDRDVFWSMIPLRGKFLFFGAVFCVFAPAMVLPARLREPEPSAVLFALAASGLIGMLWAMAFTRNMWFLAGALGLQALTVFGFAGLAPGSVWPVAAGFNAPGFAALALIVAGYTLFVLFINTEGKRSIRERTELALAQQIHAQLVPPIDVVKHGYHAYGRSITSTEVGGDLIDVLGGPDAMDLYLGDVTGHGVRSGVVMAMTKAAIHTARRSGADPSRVLAEVNDVLADLTDPGTFVTFAAIRAEPGGRVRYALAGHLPILLVRARDGSIARLENESLPLGVVAGQEFPIREARCEPGDLLVLITDGLTEVAGTDGRQLGLAGFERTLVEIGECPLPALLEAVIARVEAIGPRADDQTLLLVRAL